MPKENKQSFVGGVATLTVAVILVKIIGALYKLPPGNIIGTEGMTHFNAAYKIYSFLMSLSTAGLPLALSKLVSESQTLGRYNQSRKLLRVALTLFTVIGLAGTALRYARPRWQGSGQCHRPDWQWRVHARPPRGQARSG